MFSKEFLDFIKEKSGFLSKKGEENGLSDNELVLTQMVKLSEEVGELSQLLVASQKMQREEKNGLFTKENLESEFADIFIVTGILADKMGIKISKAVKNKMEKINKKSYFTQK